MMQSMDFFRSRIDAMINLNDPLAVLATRLPWNQIEAAVAQKFEHQNAPVKSSKTRTCLAPPRPWWVLVAAIPVGPSSPFA